ncbi:MAG: ribosome-associated translation inhibitor RaiA [Patescibacteria group bacterium]
MKLQLSTNDFQLTPAIENYLEKKLGKTEKLLSRFDGEFLFEVSIARISHQREGKILELVLNLHLPKKIIRTQEKGGDIYALIDIVEEEIARQVKTEKNKSLTKVRKGARQAKKKIVSDKG